MIGEHDEIQKANDDGEPSGTAGVPMLEVLKKQGLKDTVVVVTRYFGGIKLGGGGLIRAYGRATSEGIAATGVVERKLHHLMKITIDYTWLGKVENEARQSPYPLKEITYTDGVDLFMYVPAMEVNNFSSWMTELTNGQAVINSIDTEFLSFLNDYFTFLRFDSIMGKIIVYNSSNLIILLSSNYIIGIPLYNRSVDNTNIPSPGEEL